MLYKQRGASYIGIFFGIILAAFAIKLSVALLPPFWDDRLINKEIEASLSSLPKTATQRQFKDDMVRRLEMNNIRDLKIDDVVSATNISGGLSVKKEYQIRSAFFANVELVMTFKKEFEQSTMNGK